MSLALQNVSSVTEVMLLNCKIKGKKCSDIWNQSFVCCVMESKSTLSKEWFFFLFFFLPKVLVHVHGLYIQVLWLLHFLYYSYPPPIYFVHSNYASYSLYLFSYSSLPTDNPPCNLHFCDSVSVLVVCLVCFCFCIRCGC